MTFCEEVVAIFVADVAASVLIILGYVAIQWFLRLTDIKIGYLWRQEGSDVYPAFDIRNRAGARLYVLGNIAYRKNNSKDMVWIDNQSLMGEELKPGTIMWPPVHPVQGLTSLQDGLDTEIEVRLQNGRQVWLIGSGPGKERTGKLQIRLFRLRDLVEKWAFPLE